MRKLFVIALAAACSHAGAAGPGHPASKEAQAPASGSVAVQDAIHGVRYFLPPAPDAWQVSREGDARSAAGVESEVSSFPMPKETSAAQCRDHARSRLSPKDEPQPGAAASEAPRDQQTSDSPTATWSFTIGPQSSPVRNRWAFFARGADCLVLRVSGGVGDELPQRTFDAAAKSFEVLPLPADRQREVDLLAGMGFLERRNPEAALDRFEALANREPDLAKAHFGALMAGFEIGPQAYARALPHGKMALRSDHDLTPEQRQLALRAVGVMQLAQNQVHEAADTLAELVVRAPDLAEAQYNYACALARLGDRQGALDHLKSALRLDGELVGHAQKDDDLKSLRGSAAFEDLIKSPPAAAGK